MFDKNLGLYSLSLFCTGLMFSAFAFSQAIVYPVPGVTGPRAVEPSDINVKIELVGSFPNDGLTQLRPGVPFDADLNSPVVVGGDLYGIDHLAGIYRLNQDGPTLVYSLENAVADGIPILDPGEDPISVHPNNIGPVRPFMNLVGSPDPTTEMYVLLKTKEPAQNVPTAYLPGRNPNGSTERLEFLGGDFTDNGVADFVFPFPVNIYNLEAVFPPPDSNDEFFVLPKTYFYTLYRFTIGEESLQDPHAIASLQGQSATLHDGGALALAPAPDGRIILSTGDSTLAGMGGRSAPQQLTNLPHQDLNPVGKILLINPENGQIEIAAIGTRNAQHFAVVGEGGNQRLVWGNVGRTLAEELNSLTMAQLLDTSVVENLGWGCSAGIDGEWAPDGNCDNLPSVVDHGIIQVTAKDGTAISREGTFKVRQWFFGGGPTRISNGPQNPLDTTIQPLAQYGRWTEGLPFASITGPTISSSSFSSITALFGDLSSGRAYAITDGYEGTDVQVKRVNLVYKDSPLPSNTFNAVTIVDGECIPNPEAFEFCRVDPRFFTFPDGSAGVLLERTGKYYRLTQLDP